ncbi:MAG: hypothetical protein HY695_04570 [Deltaproteobacteria bacterium]|nr:hypothetical protein [Deltaproteobacteria bacterium]
MTPQSSFLVVAPIDPSREADLRKLLATMNHRPGVVNPQNNTVPFGQLDRLHFARFAILNDQSLNDIRAYGRPPLNLPRSLAFLGDFDGLAADFLPELVARAGDGLRRIFSHCQGFPANGELLRWMREHEQPPAALYVNWVGRTVRQIREESALRDALVGYIQGNGAAVSGRHPKEIRDDLRKFVDAETKAGRLTLTPPEPTPLSWMARNLFHLVGVPIALVLLSPLLALYLPFFIVQLRRRERQDPEIAPRPDASHIMQLAQLEDHDVTNQFSALGSVKPGLFRRWTLTFLLWVLDYTTRHIFNRGHLTRVKTIHFARWVFLDGKKRLLFASNYDGSLESYMDDFINKVAWGLNLVFSNGVGYPRTHWLICQGAKNEQRFKYYIRRHELPTEVWYNAHPGLTAFDLERNTRIREGIEKPFMTDAEIREWLKLL